LRPNEWAMLYVLIDLEAENMISLLGAFEYLKRVIQQWAT
jgi:hypothetical protein